MVRLNHLIGPSGSEPDAAQRYRMHASPNDTDGTISDEPATMQAASKITETLTGRPLDERGRRIGAPIVHYAFGVATGAAYCTLVELRPDAAAGWGAAFGMAVWLVADELGMPLAGLADPPSRYPLARHGAALLTHLGYGLTVEGTRRLLLGRSDQAGIEESAA